MDSNVVFENENLRILVYPTLSTITVQNKNIPDRKGDVTLVTGEEYTNVVWKLIAVESHFTNGSDKITQISNKE